MISSLKSRRHAKFMAKKIEATTIVGFNEYRTNFITKINECIILDEQLVKLINNMEKPLNNLLQIGETISIHANLLDNGIDLLIDGLEKVPFNQFTELNETLLQNNVIRFNRKSNDKTTDLLFITTNTSLSNKLFSSTVYPTPGGFLQATIEGENAIVNNTINALENINKSKLICELFSGCGTITIPLLLKKYKIHAFEINHETLEAINIAAKKYGLSNNVVTKNRNLKTTPLNPEELTKYDAIIIDPPRSGAHLQFSNIATSKVPIVVSISCNINTFIRDSKSLIENNYVLKWVQPIDQFLFSSHVELVGLFEIRKCD
jgi:23S rRNA (uracil1939-C5)-methyltransferase